MSGQPQTWVKARVGADGCVSRRGFLRAAGVGAAGCAGLGWLDFLTAHADEMREAHKACILLWMAGGPSQFETLDPKPGAVWWPGNIEDNKGWWGLRALGTELSRGLSHVGWIAALLGLWAFRSRLWTKAGVWILVLLSALMAAALWRLANVMGYLSDRHGLVILFCAMFWVAAGFKTAGAWLAAKIQPYWGEWTAERGLWRHLLEDRLTSGRAVTWVLFLAVIGAALPRSLETLHANRAGLRQAGLWLHDHADPSDEVIDPYYWSHFYAGRIFSEGMSTHPPPGRQLIRYIVLENGKSEHLRLTQLEEAREQAEKGRVVFRWSGRQGKHAAEVLVYEVTGVR